MKNVFSFKMVQLIRDFSWVLHPGIPKLVVSSPLIPYYIVVVVLHGTARGVYAMRNG